MAAMDLSDAQKAQVVEAVAMLLESNPDDKTPNVSAVKEVVGFDVNAAQRDEALAAVKAMQSAAEDDDAGDEDSSSEPESDADTVEVTNNMAYLINVKHNGIKDFSIGPKQTKTVENFNADHFVMALWVERGVITVE